MIVGVGIDLCEIDRCEWSAERRSWFERRIFTATEATYAKSKRRAAQHFAGSFAAKEAFRKAIGGSVPWQAVGVVHEAGGAPQLAFRADIQARLTAHGVKRVLLSITHSRETAAAVVILEGKSPIILSKDENILPEDEDILPEGET